MLLIADEVICAFRAHRKHVGQRYYGLKPDIITCAKALSSGYQPIGAVMVSPLV